MFVWSCGRGRSAGRLAGRTSGRTVVGGARVVSGAEKKAFDRGGPVWPPRSNAADDRLGGGLGGLCPPGQNSGGLGGGAPQQNRKFRKVICYKIENLEKYFVRKLLGPPGTSTNNH